MMKNDLIKLEIEGLSSDDILDLFGSVEPDFGVRVKVADNIEIENRTSPGFGVEPFSMLTVFLSMTVSIASSIVANAIYDWLKGRATEININNITVNVNVNSIKEAIDEINKQKESE